MRAMARSVPMTAKKYDINGAHLFITLFDPASSLILILLVLMMKVRMRNVKGSRLMRTYLTL